MKKLANRILFQSDGMGRAILRRSSGSMDQQEVQEPWECRGRTLELKCKCPEAGEGLGCLRNRKETCVAGG